MSLSYGFLYKIFSVLIVIQIGLVGFMLTNSKSVNYDPSVAASNNEILYEAKNQQNLELSSTSAIEKNIEKKIKLPILMYHHIDTIDNLPRSDKVGTGLRVSPEVFEKQLQFLRQNNFTTVNSFQLQDYLDGKFDLPKNPIMLTFDDGFKDNYTNAFPLLKKYNMSGDFAIVTSVVGLSDHMSWDDLKIMKAAGMSFASHTDHHCTTAIKGKKGGFEDSPKAIEEIPCSNFGIQEKLSVGQIKYEFEKSKTELEKNLDIKVTHLIYPFGFYNKQAEEIAKDLGYSFATTVQPQQNNIVDFTNPFEIGRFRVTGQQAGELNGFFVN